MTLQRLYQPDPEASEGMVEILYRLLVEPADGPGDGRYPEVAEPAVATCISAEAEG
jgi:hypothetical protein